MSRILADSILNINYLEEGKALDRDSLRKILEKNGHKLSDRKIDKILNKPVEQVREVTVNGIKFEFVKKPYKLRTAAALFKIDDKKFLNWYIVAKSKIGLGDVLVAEQPDDSPKYHFLHDDIVSMLPVKTKTKVGE